MCKQSSYSKYQKRVIKFLNDQLGTDTPFTYERTQTNHLKVLIDGVPKPIFTGSTPSDCKSINNFMAEVKREIRASKVEEGDCKPTLQLPTPIKVSNDKLIQGCIKSLRTRLPVLKSQEETHVLETHEFDDISSNRLEAVKHSISFALQARKDGVYIKRNEMKELERRRLSGRSAPNVRMLCVLSASLLPSKRRGREQRQQWRQRERSCACNSILNSEWTVHGKDMPYAKPALVNQLRRAQILALQTPCKTNGGKKQNAFPDNPS